MCDDFNDDLWDALTTFAEQILQLPHKQRLSWVFNLVKHLGQAEHGQHWDMENMAQLMVMRNERNRLKLALLSMWHQFAETAPGGTRHTGGLSALEDAAAALGIEAA